MRSAALAALLLAVPAAASDVYIGVEGSAKGGPQWTIGLPPLSAERGPNAQDAALGAKLREVLRDDLLNSRYFNVVDAPSGEAAADPVAKADEWKKAGAGVVLTARVADLGAKLSVTASLRDLTSGGVVMERYYRQDSKFWRTVPHRIADDVVRQMTGRTGIAHTQVAFVNDQTGRKEVYVVDYDGAGIRQLTRDASIGLLPRWAPDGKRLAFTSYKNGNPDLYELSLETGKARTISAKQGLNVAGGYAPDGSQLVATLSRQKNPNLFLVDLSDLSTKQLTDHFGVDTSPTFSPDGKQVAFASDRSGNPQIHVMDLDTGRLRRLTRMNWCDSPSWSPTGEWIVFAGRANPKDRMDIFIVDVTGQHVRQLTHGEGSNEDPSWSPDGRFIAFTSTRNNRRRQLFTMDADGSAPHVIGDVNGNSFTPAWGP